MEAQQAAANFGAVLGLAIGGAMALWDEDDDEVADEEDFNEFMVELEEEIGWEQSM